MGYAQDAGQRRNDPSGPCKAGLLLAVGYHAFLCSIPHCSLMFDVLEELISPDLSLNLNPGLHLNLHLHLENIRTVRLLDRKKKAAYSSIKY